jgi:hypothetical protein
MIVLPAMGQAWPPLGRDEVDRLAPSVAARRYCAAITALRPAPLAASIDDDRLTRKVDQLSGSGDRLCTWTVT